MMPSLVSAAPITPPASNPAKPHSILRSAASRKRSIDDAHSDDDSTQDVSQAAKRRKVAFASEPSVCVVKEEDEKSATLIGEEVRVALQRHNSGINDDKYEELLAVVKASPSDEDALSDAQLSKYMLALCNNSSSIKQKCSSLVHTVLRLQWLGRDARLVQRYDRFLTHLANAHSGFLSSILMMLVKNFAHLDNAVAGGSALSPEDRERAFDQLHLSISRIVASMPSALGILSSVLSSAFPFVGDSKRAHATYVANLLRVAHTFPELKAYILDLIMDRVAKIDLQVQTDIEDLDEDMEALLSDDTLIGGHDDDNDDALSDDSDDESDDELDTEERRVKGLRQAIFKLDDILDLLFEHCSPAFAGSDSEDEQTIFSILVAQFRNSLIKQYQSRHAQFLVFHFAQQSAALSTHFIDTCLDILSDKTRGESHDKVSASAYLASFVCRGAHLHQDTITYAFERLAAYVNDERKRLEPGCQGPDVRRYSPYYASVQALMYIFCFRWRNLLVDADDEDDDEPEDEDMIDDSEFTWPAYIKESFSVNFYSKLNPLKVCAPLIVDQFAQLAIQISFMFIHAKLESNKRVRLGPRTGATGGFSARQTASTMLHGQDQYQLDAYFPFDPYQLPTSKRWVATDYNEWRPPPPRAGQDAASDSSVGIGGAEAVTTREDLEMSDSSDSENE